MREYSGRALRERRGNLLYVRSAVEDLPAALTGAADRVSVVLPWGSLLAAVARPSAWLLGNVRALCQPDAVFTIVLAVDPVRDRAEWLRLGLRPLPDPSWATRLAEGYAGAGFTLRSVRPLGQHELAAWPSTWVRRLGRGAGRTLLRFTATAWHSTTQG